MNKKYLLVITVLLSFLLILSACTKAVETPDTSQESANPQEPITDQKKFDLQFSIGTASIGGAFYPIGQEISNLVTKYSNGIQMTPEVTGGAVENPRLVSNMDVELAITNANLAYFAYNGEAPYESKLEVEAIASIHPSVFHIITKADSNINSISDLKGKSIAVGPAGGGTLPILETVLGEYGLTLDDIKPSYLAYADGFSQLADSNVDVALALAGYPASAVMEMAATKAIKFVNIDDDKLKSITGKVTYYSAITVPKEVYKLENDALAVGVRNTLIVSKDIEEDVVYAITKSIFDNLDEFQEANAVAKQIDIENASKTPIPLHPGAQRYFDGK